MTQPALDLDRLLELCLIVARFGEMDLAKWWSTKGQLGRLGAAVEASLKSLVEAPIAGGGGAKRARKSRSDD